jgi:predicted ATPase
MLGYAEQALTRSHEALALAQRSAHASSIVFALFLAAVLHQCRREAQQVHKQAEEMLRLATQQGFTQWVAGGTLLRGWALVQQGAVDEGIAQLRQGLNAWLAVGNELGKTQILARLAEAYGQTGRTHEGLELLAEALAAMEANAERHYEADLYRLKGDLLLQNAGAPPPVPVQLEAEVYLQQAIAVARRQGAKFLELRAVRSLGRLWQTQDKCEAARQLLQETINGLLRGLILLTCRRRKRCWQRCSDSHYQARPRTRRHLHFSYKLSWSLWFSGLSAPDVLHLPCESVWTLLRIYDTKTLTFLRNGWTL